jgi:septation ring formation regulator EzrA
MAPADGNKAEIEQIRGDIERYQRAYLMSSDEKFRQALSHIIEELEKRLRAITGETDPP